MDHDYTIAYAQTVDNAAEREKLFIKTYIQDDIPPHQHDFFELAYVTGGTAEHTLNGVRSQLSKGNYFIVDYGSRHSYEHSKNLTLVNCLFLPEVIDDTLTGCHSFGSLINVCLLRYYKLYSVQNSANRIFTDDGGRILDILTGMRRELAQRKVGYQEILKNRLLEIIIITMRNIVDRSLKNVKSEITLQMMAYIHSRYPQHRLLTTFCEQYHYSPQYVSRKFKRDTGFTVSEYLQKTRVEKSCELLAGGRLSVTEIAEAVGYSDSKSFQALFKKMIHRSPREYRKLCGI